jgi:hypothetical protein
MTYYIDTGYAFFGIIAKRGVVVEAAPIAKWTIGKNIEDVLTYYKERKNAEVRMYETFRPKTDI